MGCGASSSRVVPNGAAPESAISPLKYLDKSVNDALTNGKIRLVSVAYILKQPEGHKLQRMQELASIKGALLSPQQAAKLMANANRSVFALSYGWLCAGEPDPYGKRFAKVKQALLWLKAQNILPPGAGMFWDFGSLPQKPRTAAEDATFKEGLAVSATRPISRDPHPSAQQRRSAPHPRRAPSIHR